MDCIVLISVTWSRYNTTTRDNKRQETSDISNQSSLPGHLIPGINQNS